MAKTSLIGNLAVNLLMETFAFEKGATLAEKRAAGMQKKFRALGDDLAQLGSNLTLSLTTPILGAGAAVVKMTGDFEGAMNRVSISTKAGAGEMKEMSDLALKLGKDTIFGATSSADAMDMLAKNGLTARQILDGAATAAVNLASAAGSELEPAANAITDVMQQFKLTTKDLPLAVNQITGAVNESKLSFDDFALAIGQAGGVAGASGVGFVDFNAVLAGTSSLFASGSDAGTSFKTFLTTLPGKSDAAAGAIAELGLQFYNADGSLRGMAEIAQELQDKLGGLSDVAKQQYLTQIFGTDAMRTAVGLMDLGAKGIERIKAGIAQTDAAAQSAQRLKGFNGQLEQLKGAVETLAIRIGQSGVLEVVTRFVTVLSDFIDKMSEASPGTLRFATGFALIAAAVGPVLFIVGKLVALFAPLLAAAGGFSALAAAAAPPLAALAAVGALIYANWDKIAPVLQDLWQQVQQTLGPPLQQLVSAVSAIFTEFWNGPLGEGVRGAGTALVALSLAWTKAFGPVALQVIRAAIEALTGVFKLIGDGVKLVSALFNGDWKTAFVAAASIVNRMFGGLPAYVIDVMRRMVTGIAQWVGTRLTAIWNGVKAKIEAVKGWFFGLYDAVVGHSYVPDMVDGIAAQMQRLDKEMVEPAKNAAEKTKEHFRKLREDLRGLLDDLYPEARERIELGKEFQTIDESEKAKFLSREEANRARFDLAAKNSGVRDNLDFATPVGDAFGSIGEGIADFVGDIGRAAAETAEKTLAMKQSFQDMARDTIGALNGLASSIKSGGFLDIFSSIVDVVMQLGSMGVFGKGIQNNLTKPFGGGRAMGGPVVPSKSYIVGERGPEWFTPASAGTISPMNDNSTRTLVEVVPSPYFDAHVKQRAAQVAAPMAAAAGMHARQAAGGDMTRRSRRRIPG